MEILRLKDTTSIQATFIVPTASATYFLEYDDILTGASLSASATSNMAKSVTFTLDDRYLTYSGNLEANIYNQSNDIVISTGIDIIKPYCDIKNMRDKLNLTNAQIDNAERIARMIIESEAGSFQFIRQQRELYGMGIDYLPIKDKIVKLYYMWENGELIYDYEDSNLQGYKISKDKTSIIPAESEKNKLEYKKVWRDRYYEDAFEDGYDYLVDADFGYKTIPSNVQEACEILIQDIVSDNMKYYNRNISEFDNNEFRIKFADGTSSGTGNILVDKLLSRYKNQIYPGVL